MAGESSPARPAHQYGSTARSQRRPPAVRSPRRCPPRDEPLHGRVERVLACLRVWPCDVAIRARLLPDRASPGCHRPPDPVRLQGPGSTPLHVARFGTKSRDKFAGVRLRAKEKLVGFQGGAHGAEQSRADLRTRQLYDDCREGGPTSSRACRDGPTRGVGWSEMELIAPVARLAMALATRQHYLAEVSEKPAGGQDGVDEWKGLDSDKWIGTLRSAAAWLRESGLARTGRHQRWGAARPRSAGGSSRRDAGWRESSGWDAARETRLGGRGPAQTWRWCSRRMVVWLRADCRVDFEFELQVGDWRAHLVERRQLGRRRDEQLPLAGQGFRAEAR